jgi:hypothetical protein
MLIQRPKIIARSSVEAQAKSTAIAAQPRSEAARAKPFVPAVPRQSRAAPASRSVAIALERLTVALAKPSARIAPLVALPAAAASDRR